MAWAPKNCIVVPTDFSESAQDSIGTALELVSKPADVHVIHVLMGCKDRDLLDEWATPRQDEAWDAAARAYLAEFLQKHGFANVTQAIRLGDTGFEITDYARECNAGLIVIPSHGYHGVKRLLVGSVAERVVRYATCPVLVLRRHDTD